MYAYVDLISSISHERLGSLMDGDTASVAYRIDGESSTNHRSVVYMCEICEVLLVEPSVRPNPRIHTPSPVIHARLLRTGQASTQFSILGPRTPEYRRSSSFKCPPGASYIGLTITTLGILQTRRKLTMSRSSNRPNIINSLSDTGSSSGKASAY